MTRPTPMFSSKASTPGVGWADCTLPQAKPTIVFKSPVTRIRPWLAAQARMIGSGVWPRPTSTTRTMSRFASRRRRPRITSSWTSSSLTRRSRGYFHLCLPGQQFGPQFHPVGLLGLYFLPQLLGLLSANVEVIVNLFPVPEVIGDHAVDVRQVERRIALDNGFRFGAVIELPDHDVHQHLRVSNADDAVFVDPKRAGVGLDSQRHGLSFFPDVIPKMLK